MNNLVKLFIAFVVTVVALTTYVHFSDMTDKQFREEPPITKERSFLTAMNNASRARWREALRQAAANGAPSQGVDMAALVLRAINGQN